VLGKTATFVFDLENESPSLGVRSQRHVAPFGCELKRILHQVRHGGREKLRIRIDGERGIDRVHREPHLAALGMKDARRRNLVEQLDH